MLQENKSEYIEALERLEKISRTIFDVVNISSIPQKRTVCPHGNCPVYPAHGWWCDECFWEMENALEEIKELQLKSEEVQEDTETKNEPLPDDIFLRPSGYLGSKTSLSCGGCYIGEFDSDEDALSEVRKWMERHNFYPTIWYVSDHGNSWPITIEGKETK